jgi:hypothetical protein
MEAIVAKHFKPEKVAEFNTRFALVKDLANKVFTSPKEIYAKYPDLVTPEQANGIWNKSMGDAQKGGVTSQDLLSPAISSAIDRLLGIFIPEVREPIKFALGFVFILSYVERLPGFGSLVGAAMDITAAFLPMSAVAIQTTMPNLMALIPLPYMNFAGMAIGWVFSAVLLFMAIMLGVSRKQFGSAIEATAGLIPIVGVNAMNFVRTTNNTAAKLNDRRLMIANEFGQVVDVLKKTAAGVGEETKNALTNIVSEAKTAATPTVAVGGRKKRFSRRQHIIRKWRTTRRIKSGKR